MAPPNTRSGHSRRTAGLAAGAALVAAVLLAIVLLGQPGKLTEPTAPPAAPGTPSPTAATTPAARDVALPVDGFFDRQTLNRFGTQVTEEFRAAHRDLFPAATSEYPKFYGYHAAADAEYSAPSEASTQAPVRAIAPGTVVYKDSVTGYGGLIIVRHEQPERITSLYGHVRLSDSPVNVGDQVTTGQVIAYLGAPFSAETSGERKHLHFGIHKGSETDLQGYEPNESALNAGWYDPNAWLREQGL